MKITPSPLLGQASGKLGSLVFSHNAAGPYVRTYVVPVNHKSNVQKETRNIFSVAAATWCTLSDVEKEQWHNYAKDPVRFTPLYKMNTGGVNGMNAFIAHSIECAKGNILKTNVTNCVSTPTGLSLQQITYTVPNNPPNVPVDGTLFGKPIIANATISYASGIYTITLTIQPVGGATNPITVPPGSELKDGHQNTVGFAVYISTSKKNNPNYSMKMVRKILHTPTAKNDTANPLNVTSIQFTGTYNPSTRNFAFPQPNEIVDITVAMVSIGGQTRKIWQNTEQI